MSIPPENCPAGSDFYHHYAGYGGDVDVNGLYGFPFPASYGLDVSGGEMQGYCNSQFYNCEASEITEAAVAVSRHNHKEAEKRRRERINSHLDRLRSLLPCNSKTDKATLLSKVVQRVLDLKHQTSGLVHLHSVPSEHDELAVDTDIASSGAGEVVIRASLCCEDRPDLFSDLNQTLSSLQLRTVRAEVSTLGGRIRNVLIISGDHCNGDELRDALRGIIERSNSSGDRLKRRRRLEPC